MPGRRRFAGPFARWPRTADTVLAVVILLLNTFTDDTAGDALHLRDLAEVGPLGLVLIVVGSVALVWRRRQPLLVLGVVLVASALALPVGEAPLGALPLALYAAGRYGPEVRENAAGLVAAMVVLVLAGVRDALPLAETLFGVFVFDVLWYIGRRLRQRSQREDALRRERAADAARAVADERARIARELHDVVAHRVSLMTVQAGAAKTVVADDPDGAYRSMEAVEQAGRQALGELRHLLGILRPEGDDGRGPQPGLADLPRLVAQFEQAGLRISLRVDGHGEGLPAPVELSAYRIVQESLTNVLKHARAGAHVDVRLAAGPTGLDLEVVDDGSGVSHLPASGHGIAGMRERASLLGGELHAGPRPTGGFRVAARLPTATEPA